MIVADKSQRFSLRLPPGVAAAVDDDPVRADAEDDGERVVLIDRDLVPTVDP